MSLAGSCGSLFLLAFCVPACAVQLEVPLCLDFMLDPFPPSSPTPCSLTLPALAIVFIHSGVVWFTQSLAFILSRYAGRNDDIFYQILNRKIEVISIIYAEGMYPRELVT